MIKLLLTKWDDIKKTNTSLKKKLEAEKFKTFQLECKVNLLKEKLEAYYLKEAFLDKYKNDN